MSPYHIIGKNAQTKVEQKTGLVLLVLESVVYVSKTKGPFSYLVFCPRMRPSTFLQCFALASRCYKAKHCRNVLRGSVKNFAVNSIFRAYPVTTIRAPL